MSRFDEVIERRGTHAVKWDGLKTVFGREDVLPMWVADMDFKAPDEVSEAIQKAAAHGIFGYTIVPDSTKEVIVNWMQSRHHWSVQKEWLLFNHGVVPSIGAAVEALTKPGDAVIVQPPVYNPFFEMIERNERKLVHNELLLKDGRYEMDFADLEEKIQTEKAKMVVLCSPHNPGGRVWTKEELTTLCEICEKHNVYLVSDEIHADLTREPNKHLPAASLSERYAAFTVTLVAPSKTFNLAGLQASALIIPNKDIRTRLQKVFARQGQFTLNQLGIAGMEAAYRHGSEWLEEALDYIQENARLVKEYAEKNIPSISVMEPEGSYLVWVDCRSLGLPDKELLDLFLVHGVALGNGAKYGPGGEGFMRINVACPRATVEETMNRMKKAVESL
ncbi:MalY/PatB family protein [Domibacillus enclensis]|uniref:cysteine-S-conjugate beta-lyase n=1 Tax=Domibacillus enclensis TaxID=1017273 RepID=A0A1N6YHK9_9BACI|nr:MalY/PatB family protein [Domibacillus enclensis]OXS77629.1 cystathionine beta-lyase [Domibacillus enclensis]SIR13981.1 cystathione beta-lyase [Domibacillus enclensis]